MRVRSCFSLVALMAAALLSMQCSMDPIAPQPVVFDDYTEPDVDTTPGTGKPAESAGNCLSFPVIWSDGISRELRGAFGQDWFAGLWTDADDPGTGEIDLQSWYHQGDAANEWQAESRDQLALGPLEISRIDWGDNLEARAWDEHSVVRIETVLYQDLAGNDKMTGYRMLKLNDASGPTEIWGTNGHTYQSHEASVYSGCARLTIQKLTRLREDPALTLTWDASAGEWTGDVASTVFNGGVWEASDGPGFYSAEINVQGKCIYGFNWFVRDIADAVGDYRITFSLDNSDASPSLNTFITDATTIMMPEEEASSDGDVLLGGGGPGSGGRSISGGGVARVAGNLNLTFIDVRITGRTGGGRGSN